MEPRVPDGVEAGKILAVGADLSDPDLLGDCAELDVGQAWEALRAAQELYGVIGRRTGCAARVLLEPNAN